jgi:hypothetical protein
MSRRALVVFALAVSASLIGCADSITAPPQPTVAPSTPRSTGVQEPGACKGGYVLSEGRCA